MLWKKTAAATTVTAKKTVYLLTLLLILGATAVTDNDANASESITDNANVVDLSATLSWGMGLRPISGSPLPVRYFFVQLRDTNGENFTTALPPNTLSLSVTGVGVASPASATTSSDVSCRFHTSLVNAGDGLFIGRYRLLYTACASVTIDMVCRSAGASGQSVGGFPVHLRMNTAGDDDSTEIDLNAPILPDVCVCPRATRVEWAASLDCPTSFDRIERDFAAYGKRTNGLRLDFERVLRQADDRWGTQPGAFSFCHYQFLDNQIYRHCYGKYVGFNMFSDAIFLSLARKYKLPDMDLLMNLGDWPLETNIDAKIDDTVPMLSWCGSDGSMDIIFPTYDLTEATLEMMGRQHQDIQQAMTKSNWSWDKKIDKGFFRGRDSRQERLDLVQMSREHPDDLQADITRFFFFRDEMHMYGPEAETIAFEEFFKYRYQINVDGTVAAYRLPFLLAGDSLVLKQDSPYYEHFYAQLTPYVHYVPLQRNLSDVLHQIRWARSHPEQVKDIMRNARKFVLDNLQPEHIFCYHSIVLQYQTNNGIEQISDREFFPVVMIDPGECGVCRFAIAADGLEH